jgi:VWFA-related protein
MKRITAGVLTLAMLLATPLLAASRVTVHQLSDMLTSARASGRSDGEIVREIGRVELTDRLTDATLSSLSRDQGERTQLALRILADESAFLDPPPSELPNEGPPALAERKAILARAGDYALAYMRDLPNFVCTHTIHRLDDDPSAAHRSKAESVGRLQEGDTIVSELAFNNGAESNRVRTVNGQVWSNAHSLQGLSTFGDFGAIIGSLFAGSGARAAWSHWETIDGKRVAVFNYSVDRAHSAFVMSWCCVYEHGGWRHEKPAYRGELFIEPASGAIVRVTRQAVDVSPGFPTRRSDTVVEFRVVNIGDKSWLCPVRSVTIAEIVKGDHPTDLGLRVRTLNDVEFTEYHKFESASALVAADTQGAEGKADVSTPPSVPTEPPALSPPPVTDSVVAQPLTLAVSPSATDHSLEELAPPASGAAQPVVTLPAAVLSGPPGPEPLKAPADTQAIFRVRTNVVTVRVVVRDHNGHPVGDLRKDEFEISDNGEPQTISSFAVERPTAANLQPVLSEHATKPVGEPGTVREAVQVPDRYVMYVVDDLSIEFGDLSQTRAAAERVLQDAFKSNSRVAVLTTSGRIVLDFTSDAVGINNALNRITPQGRANVTGRCPPISHYLAYLIVELDDEMALGVAGSEAASCGAAIAVKPIAEQVLSEYNAQTRAVLEALRAAVRRISIMPGLRTLVLISPGFLTPDLESQVNEVIDRAVRAGVVINTLDARGVWVLPGFDAETRSLSSPTIQRVKRQYDEQEQQLQTDVLIHLAEGTGGEISRDNDYAGGFRRLTAVPNVSYVLGFTPTKLKVDGRFHKLKVTVVSRKGLTVQARNGYFAPKQTVDAAEQAKEEIENAVFSRDEIQDIPVTLRMQVSQGKLSAIAHFGIGGIRFVQKDGHNRSSLTATVSLFDADGNYVKGVQDVVNLDFPDDKLPSAIAAGEAVRADFDAPAGSYVVRLVLRDNDGHMSSTSRRIDVH